MPKYYLWRSFEKKLRLFYAHSKKGRGNMLTRIFGAVTDGRLNLRAVADSSAAIIASIPNETLLVVTAHDDTWYANRLKLCLNLSFACSLRLGELLALTWDCVDISEESIREG